MCRILLTALVVFLLLSSISFSGDLYLLSIDSKESLNKIRLEVPFAYGTFDGKFLVDLSPGVAAKLLNEKIPLEMISENFIPSDFYIVSKIHPDASVKNPVSKARYSSGNNFIARLNQADVQNLQNDVYIVTAIRDKRTPFFYVPTAIAVSQLEDFPMDSLANRIIQDSLYNYTARLEAFRTRYIYTDSVNRARDWLVNKFHSFGYSDADVYYDTFYFNGYPCNNVICVKPGTTEADRIIVVGGHFDSWNSQTNPMTYAPGADDNGSGTAAVLEMARILKDIDLKKTVMFVAFSAEEVGLVGSYATAQRLYYQGSNVECMFNFDMIAYTADAYPNVNIYSGPFKGYAELLAAAYQRTTDLVPVYAGAATNSDHASFVEFGYDVAYAEEGDFNTAGWHTDLDLSSRLNFGYMTKVVKGATAALGQIDRAASTTTIDHVYDIGDGQSLRISWANDCRTDYTYKILYGITSGVYTDTLDVPPPACTYDITGLVEGQTYYVSVLGINSEGFGPAYLLESSGVSYVRPRIPSGFVADPDSAKIRLRWHGNLELDIDHYQLLRRDSLNDWSNLIDSYTDTIYFDNSAEGHVVYQYKVLAVDHDLNISDSSITASAVPGTFDGGILFVDETAAGGMNPSEAKQAAFYDSIMTGITFTKTSVGAGQKMSRSVAGQYSTLIWVDDDVSGHLFNTSEDSLKWYLQYDVHLFLAGWESIYWLTGSPPLNPGDFAYDYLGISQVTENASADFTGATGVNGWPNLQVVSGGVFGGVLPTVSKIVPRPGVEVIYTYNSQSGNPAFQGQPAGIIYTEGNSKRISLTFPIYYLTEASAQALMTKVKDYLNEVPSTRPNGDVNNDMRLNILDISYLINYLYKTGPAPNDLNFADVNQSCDVNILDILYMIRFLYKSGSGPLAGCVH